ncbi:hypothetical protein CPC08DRAFT_411795 [Agrocybe pediades]|nr:hypothetical protein CPC08DRAFT_411795 [Agrocybe pediades]
MQSSPEDGVSRPHGSSPSDGKPQHTSGSQQPLVMPVENRESTHSNSKAGQITRRSNDSQVMRYPPGPIKSSRETETKPHLPSKDSTRVDGGSDRNHSEDSRRHRASSWSSGGRKSYEITNAPPGIDISNNSTIGPIPNIRPPSEGQGHLIDSSNSGYNQHYEPTQAPARKHRPDSLPTGNFELRVQKSSDPNIPLSTDVSGHQIASVSQSYSDERTRKSSSQQDRSATKLQSGADAVVPSSRPPRKDDHYLADLKQDPSYPVPETYPREIGNPPIEIPGLDSGALPFVEPELRPKNSKEISSKFGAVFAHATRSIFASKATDAEEEIKLLKAEIDDLKSDNSDIEARYRRNRKARKELQKENQQLREDLQAAHYRLRQIEQELVESKNLAETRGKELMGAQVFLTKADSLSQEEITGMVEALNQEIFQFAASLGEFLVFQNHEFKDNDDFTQTVQFVNEILGADLVQTLINMAHASDPSLNPLVIQSVISICLVNFCMKTLQTWYTPDNHISTFIQNTYAQIRSNEEQAVSGRWRAITRAHTRVSSEARQRALVKSLQAAFRISSWYLTSDGQAAFPHKVVPFFKIMDDLSISLGEKFTSADLEVFEIKAGDKFNHKQMEDVFGDSRSDGADSDQSNSIVGTAGLGLRKVISVRSDSGIQTSVELLLPPKVILTSTLQEALEPPPPRKARQRRD